MIFSFGERPIIQAGSKELANSDLVCLGGILTISRLILPVDRSLNFLARDYRKIVKPRAVGKRHKAVNTLPPVLVERLRAGVRTC